jgi:hypothetical protein
MSRAAKPLVTVLIDTFSYGHLIEVRDVIS